MSALVQAGGVRLSDFSDIPTETVLTLEWDAPNIMPEPRDYAVFHGDLADYAGFVVAVNEATGRVRMLLNFTGATLEPWTVDLVRVDVLLTRHSLEMETAAALSALAEFSAA